LGLGLAIVRHLVEAHGGSVGADSPGSGQGATFTVSLPLSDGVAALRTPPARSDEPSIDLQGVSVLLVEDDADWRQSLTPPAGAAARGRRPSLRGARSRGPA